MYNLNNLNGIPFVDRGRKISGCDCMGLAILAHRSFGKNIPDFNVCSDSSLDINNLFNIELHSGTWTKIEKPETPCIVVFGFFHQGIVTHVGTYIGNGKILHTINDKRKQENSVSHTIRVDHPFYKNKILGFYKYEQN